MVAMISDLLKPAVTRVITPTAKGLLRMGLTPNSMTVVGGIGVVASSFALFPSGHFFAGTLVVTFFVLSDLFDGTMARISQKGSSQWGSFLDSTVDRVTDSSILIALILGLDDHGDPLIPVILFAILTGLLVPYIRAKAESIGVQCSGGLAERTERLIIALVTIGLHGLGVPYALAVGMWLLAVLGTFTVIQRVVIVKKAVKNL
jgi:CDP-diacylglycerol--glycerol-3-phosphate 3-phosphatidyltransferase